ncbi:two-component sensor histidine kinase [Claveliimonas bilis]|uniref:sensor histidine kinase n=1 Tax=Claveliimonas bilis TaxID=3028070 RepID=UPI00293074DB|nr:HAMP domain-containing sensor histidine kinase [Claveliimonas bilis]BDZ82026.1 two-component sensor histidine kinase [Claveliimonas bilis]
MIKKSVVGINAVVIICFTIILVYQKNGILLFLLALLLVGLYLLWADQQKEYQSELGEISIWLDDLLQKKDISYYSVQKDTLAAKILSQLQRVQKMYGGIATLVENERDGIKKLLAEIAHQLRTPLSNMETYLALLEDNSIGDAEKETYIKAVEKSENKLHFLIEKFIVAARLENQIIQIHKCDSNLKETVAQAVFQVRKKAEEKNINIVIQGEDADKKVLHDRNWLCEAIYNLLDNSIKYSPMSMDIIVKLTSNEMFSEICVEDNGIGIKKGEENKIFQLYYRGTNISNQEGYGMGLFIAREIVQKHDGFIKVKRKNSGLTMSIVLPKAGT